MSWALPAIILVAQVSKAYAKGGGKSSSSKSSASKGKTSGGSIGGGSKLSSGSKPLSGSKSSSGTKTKVVATKCHNGIVAPTGTACQTTVAVASTSNEKKIIGIVLGIVTGIICVVLLTLLLVQLYRRRNRNRGEATRRSTLDTLKETIGEGRFKFQKIVEQIDAHDESRIPLTS